ncbi:S8 family serine peptidase [Micromonospora sp. M12]
MREQRRRPRGSPGNGGSSAGYFTAGSDKKVTLTDGADRRPDGRAAAGQRATTDSSGRYVVELAEDPLTTYTGGVSDLVRTRPAAGNRLDVTSAPSQAYRRHLDTSGRRRPRGRVTVDAVYTTAFNGFSAKLTAQQASTLRADKRVRAVTASRALGTRRHRPPRPRRRPPIRRPPIRRPPIRRPPSRPKRTSRRLRASPAVRPAWPRHGAGMVIGVLDTGIWPESASFAKPMPAPANWHGTCQTGVAFVAEHCNGKIVGARYFADSWLAGGGSVPEGEVLSPAT